LCPETRRQFPSVRCVGEVNVECVSANFPHPLVPTCVELHVEGHAWIQDDHHVDIGAGCRLSAGPRSVEDDTMKLLAERLLDTGDQVADLIGEVERQGAELLDAKIVERYSGIFGLPS